jgi:hypothetical protein
MYSNRRFPTINGPQQHPGKATHMRVVSLCLCIGATLTIPLPASAFCQPGTADKCTINGRPGTKTCLPSGFFGPCEPTERPPPPVTGTVTGKYIVTTVIYAPPGSDGGKGASIVSYGTGSSTGTTTTNSNSFKKDYSVSATVKFGLGCSTNTSGKTTCPLSVGGGGSFEYTKNANHAESTDVKKSVSSTIVATGPSVDGVDHERDEIWLLLRPKFDFSISGKTIVWSFDPDQSGAVQQFVYAGALKDPSKLPPGLVRDFQAAGITPQDYADILSYDPLAQCALPLVSTPPCNAPPPTAPRYVSAFTSIPYDPPFAQGDTVPTQTISIDNTTTTTHTDAYQIDKKLGITVETGVDFGPVFQATLTETNQFTWTSANSTANSAGNEQKMSLTIGGPAFGYAGPVNLAVYYDTLYQTFVFVPFEIAASSLHGVVLSNAGKPRAGQAVTAIAGDVKYRTFTNSAGEYRFPNEVAGAVVLQAGNIVQHLPQIPPDRSVDLRF